jgi:60s Acidic ribosomal protein
LFSLVANVLTINPQQAKEYLANPDAFVVAAAPAAAAAADSAPAEEAPKEEEKEESDDDMVNPTICRCLTPSLKTLAGLRLVRLNGILLSSLCTPMLSITVSSHG